MANAKIGKPNKHSQKPVIDLSSGIIFDSAKDASQHYNINYKTLMDKLSGHSKNNTNLSYIV